MGGMGGKSGDAPFFLKKESRPLNELCHFPLPPDAMNADTRAKMVAARFDPAVRSKDAAWHAGKYDELMAKARELAALDGLTVPADFVRLFRDVVATKPSQRFDRLMAARAAAVAPKKAKRMKTDVLACLAHPTGQLLADALDVEMLADAMSESYPIGVAGEGVSRSRALFELSQYIVGTGLIPAMFGLDVRASTAAAPRFDASALRHLLDVRLPAVRIAHELGERGTGALPDALAFLRGLGPADRTTVRNVYFVREQHDICGEVTRYAAADPGHGVLRYRARPWRREVRDAVGRFRASEDVVDRALESSFEGVQLERVLSDSDGSLAALRAFVATPSVVPVPRALRAVASLVHDMLSNAVAFAEATRGEVYLGILRYTEYDIEEGRALVPLLQPIALALAVMDRGEAE